MFGSGYLSSLLQKKIKQGPETQFTVGRVIDTNDPTQMGRVRVQCSAWGDDTSKELGNIPFAFPVSPLAGLMLFGERGPEGNEIEGPTSYGMWNTPKIGSYVVVGCLDGHRGRRFYVGGIHPHLLTHTMPHGRYMWLEEENGKPDGPLDTFENPIQPLYDSQTEQFTKQTSTVPEVPSTPSDPRKNLEWRTRGVDMSSSAVSNENIREKYDAPGSEKADRIARTTKTIVQEDGTSREIDSSGYAISQIEDDIPYESTGKNYDSHNYSWTTPGFHSFSMNDRKDNCRIRLRSTTGHQIIMDDTNERIYVSTAGGETWIELDNVGNIDIYASKNISTHARGDINLYSDKTIRMQAKEGIHLQTDDQFRIHALEDIHVRTEKNVRMYSYEKTYIETRSTLNLLSSDDMRMQSNTRMSLRSQSDFISGDAQQVHWNSAFAAQADPADEIQANWTTRVPEHEPWARVFMKETDSDATATDKVNLHTPEYSYTSQLVGKGGRGDTYTRNDLWKR